MASIPPTRASMSTAPRRAGSLDDLDLPSMSETGVLATIFIVEAGCTGQFPGGSEAGRRVGGAAPRVSHDSLSASAMAAVREILSVHPSATPTDELVHCIDECLACAASCTACADACLGEEDVGGLRECVRANLDCADLCDTTAGLLSRQTGTTPTWWATILSACAESCRRCAEECEQHSEHHAHCRLCAEACRRCEQACGDLINSGPAT